MGKDKSKMMTMIPWIATLLAAAFVLITSVTFGGPGFGKTWPLIPTVLFASLAVTYYMDDMTAAWPGLSFLSSVFLLWLLGNTGVAPFSRTWPFLLLIAVLLIIVAVMLNKNKKKK
ncbi:MAG: hypothetical protein JXR95_02240 [Deltaproteobacteria bacterium]|nr:hypothetical protein [Deltaproteobacteria bacterium]